jgi:hypothetical protein
MVCNQGKSKILGKTCGYPILLDMGTKRVNTGQEWLSIVVACENEVVVERIGFVPLLIAEGGKVVGILLD